MPPPLKRQRLDVASPLGAVTVFSNKDILENISSYLELRSVNAMTVVCRQWKQEIWQNHRIWKQLLFQRYPNLPRALPAKVLPQLFNGGRDAFLQALTLHTDKMRPVRTSSLPVPLQQQVCGGCLLEKWKPDAVVFLIDIWKGPVRIVSESVTIPYNDCPGCVQESVKACRAGGRPGRYPSNG